MSTLNNNQKEEKTEALPRLLEDAKFKANHYFRKAPPTRQTKSLPIDEEDDFDWSKVHGPNVLKWQNTGTL